ncbi:fumarate hydratase [Chloroflexota bacterium]
MITEGIIEKAAYEAMKTGVTVLPADILLAVKDAYSKEKSTEVKRIYDNFFEYVERRSKTGGSICPDTGTIMYYISIGSKVELEPTIDFWKSLAKVTIRLTKEGILAPKSADPIRRINNNINVGENSPSIQYKLVPGIDYLEITAVAKGGGGEIMGSRFRMMTTNDLPVIKKYIIDGAVASTKYGFGCPPIVLGVGIGGGLGIAGAIATEAAVLRPVGVRNPDSFIADIEEEVAELINYTGIGPAGLGGQCTVSDVHIEFSNGHEGVVAVALVSQCLMAHRATVRISRGGTFERADYPEAWFTRPWLNYKEMLE